MTAVLLIILFLFTPVQIGFHPNKPNKAKAHHPREKPTWHIQKQLPYK